MMTSALGVSSFCSFVEGISSLNDHISGIKPALTAFLSSQGHKIPGGVIIREGLIGAMKCIGLVSYLSKVYSFFNEQPSESDKNEEKYFQLFASRISLTTKTISYADPLVRLISTHPVVLAALAITKLTNTLFKGIGVTLAAASVATETEGSLRLKDYLTIVALTTVSYGLLAPLMIMNAPWLASATMIGYVASVSSFALGILLPAPQ